MLLIFSVLIISPTINLCGTSVWIVTTWVLAEIEPTVALLITLSFLNWIVFVKSPDVFGLRGPGSTLLLSWRINPYSGGLAVVNSFGIT